MKLPLILALLACASPSQSERQEPLATYLAAEQSLDFVFTYSQRADTGWGKITIPTLIDYDWQLRLRRAPDQQAVDGTVYELSFGRVVGRIESIVGTRDFDSDDENAEYSKLMSTALRPILEPVGKQVEVTLSRSGHVQELRGWEQLFTSKAADPLMAASAPMSDSWFRDVVQLIFARLPEAPPVEGLRWDTEVSVPFNGWSITFRPRNVLTKLDEVSATWGFATVVDDVAPAADPVEASAARRWVSEATSISDASLVGQSVVSCADGFPLSQRVELKRVFSMKNPMGGDRLECHSAESFVLVRREQADRTK